MRRQRGLVLALAAWLAVGVSAQAQTADDAVKAVPKEALGFVIVNNLSAFSGKIEAAAKKVGAPLPMSPLDKLKSELGIEKGLNATGSALVVVLLSEGSGPAGLLYLPVSDYKAFLKGLNAKGDGQIAEAQLANGKALVVAHHGAFAVLAEANFKSVLETALKATPAGAALAPVQPWINDHDISGVLPANAIQMLAMMGQQGLGMVKQMAGAAPPELQFLSGWIDGLSDFLKEIGTDVSHVALGGRLDAQRGLSLGMLALYVKDSGFAKAGAAAHAPEGSPLVGLPAVPYVLALGGAVSQKAMSGLMNLGMTAMSAMMKDVPPEKMKKLEQATSDLVKGMHGMAMLLGTGKGKETLLQNAYAVLKVDDSAAYLRAYKKSIAISNEVFKDLKLPAGGAFPGQNTQAKDATINGLPALEIQVDMKAALENNPAQLKDFMDLYVGPDGKMDLTAVAVDKQTLLIRYTGAAGMKAFLKDYKDKTDRLAQDQGVIQTLSLLPTGSQTVALVNMTGAVDMVNRFAAVIPQAGGFQLPPFRPVPPIGFGVKASASGVEARLVLPAPTLEAIGTFVRQLRPAGAGAVQ
jgi:hypothetical protein